MKHAGTVAGFALIAASCGYVGDPLPPALNIPQPVADLRAQQVESTLEATFTIPPQTTENLPVTDLTSVELHVGRMPAGGWNLEAWLASAKAVRVQADEPGPVEATASASEYIGQEVVLAVRMANRKGRVSQWSNLVTLKIEPPVATPAAFVADSAPNGALLTWTGFAGPVSVFRDGAKIGDGANGKFADLRAELGKSYSYQIQARGDKALGALSPPVKLTIEDRFPPTAPTGLTAVAGAGTVEVSWNPNPENDILGYSVLRAAGPEDFSVVAAFIDAPAYTDKNVQRGVRYRYMVTALDLRKNQSAKSIEVEISVP